MVDIFPPYRRPPEQEEQAGFFLLSPGHTGAASGRTLVEGEREGERAAEWKNSLEGERDRSKLTMKQTHRFPASSAEVRFAKLIPTLRYQD